MAIYRRNKMSYIYIYDLYEIQMCLLTKIISD